MAVAEVNQAGGINGRQVELIVENEKDSPADRGQRGEKAY